MILKILITTCLAISICYSPAFAAGENSDAIRAIELCKQGKAREAMPFFESALRKAPGDAQLFYNRALAHQRLGETDNSIKDYTASLRLSPLNTKAYYNRAQAFLSKNEYVSAKRDLDKVLTLERKNPDAYLTRGNVWYGLERYQHAIKDFDKSIELQPSSQGYINRGNTEQRLGLMQQASIDYGEALKIDPGAGKALFERALLFLCLGKYELAERDASKFIEIKSWKDETAPYAAYIQILAAKLNKNPTLENKVVGNLLLQKPQDNWIRDLSLYLSGKIPASKLIATAGSNRDQLTEAHTYIGMTLYCNGKFDEAKKHLLWVLQNGNRMFDEFTLAQSFANQVGKSTTKNEAKAK